MATGGSCRRLIGNCLGVERKNRGKATIASSQVLRPFEVVTASFVRWSPEDDSALVREGLSPPQVSKGH